MTSQNMAPHLLAQPFLLAKPIVSIAQVKAQRPDRARRPCVCELRAKVNRDLSNEVGPLYAQACMTQIYIQF